jgi:hypothetical protein
MNAAATKTKSKITYKGGDGKPRQEFTVEFFKKIAADLAKKGITAHRTVLDDQVTGLRAICRSTGRITFHVNYLLDQGLGREGNDRPYQLLGTVDDLTVAEARYIASVVIELGKLGVDIRQGPRPERLIGELREWGVKWRPGITGSRETNLHVTLDAKTLDKALETAKENPNTIMVLADTECVGLRAIVHQRDPIRFRVNQLTLGTYPKLSVAEARKMARPLIDLLAKGVKIEEDEPAEG